MNDLSFEEAIHVEQDVEYWIAEIFSSFLSTVVENSKSLINSHFRVVMKMVNLGSGTRRKIPDIMPFIDLKGSSETAFFNRVPFWEKQQF